MEAPHGISLHRLVLLVALHALPVARGAPAPEPKAAVRRLSGRDACNGFDEMWGLCPDLPKCEECTPIDCAFGDWGEWYDSFGGCTGLRFHERTVAVANNECGKPCSGPKIESVEHVPDECLLEQVNCVLSEWSEWSQCQAVTGQIYRKREVLTHPANGGEPCTGSTEETLPCGQGPTPVPCVFSDWQAWTACSATCGSGRHTRMRRVVSEAQHSGDACEGMTLETEPCNLEECGGRDCIMGDWSDWSMCDPERHPQRFRRRLVQQSATGTGMRCNQTMKETEGCPAPPMEPCRLSEWSEWKALGWEQPDPPSCNKECGGGQAFRTRFMQAPPSHGGSCPESSLRQLRPCNTQPCNAVCEMSDWSSWSACSANCGKGSMQRSRSLLNPEARYSEGCQGALDEALPCIGEEGMCPHTDCQWSEWYDWSVCSASCGGGLMRRSRMVDAPPKNGGAACEALVKSEAAACNTQSCGADCIDGKWGDWGDWESCTASCSSAHTVRRRSIAQHPNACGAPVSGIGAEYKACSDLPSCTVDVDCQLSEWSEWSFCSCTCFGIHERNRYIKVFSSGQGAPCSNTSLKEVAPCNPGPGEEPSADCGRPEPRDCELSEWAEWTACSKSCGGGQMERKRKILTLPVHGGKSCDTELTLTAPCNAEPCAVESCTDCVWGMWSDWGDCTHCGGQRYRHRSIEQMPNHCGAMCDLQSAKEVSNCSSHCEKALFCAWTEWSAPSGCNAGCGHGTMMRSRALSLQPAPLDFLFSASSSVRCQGAQLNVSECPNMQPCSPPCVPQDCEFSTWDSWSAPTSTGLCERHRSIAATNNECGRPCSGAMGETKRCELENPDRKDCVLSDWTPWSLCRMNGKLGQRNRERSVVVHPSFDGVPCNATLNETQQCSTLVARDCALSQWGDWSECRKSCGGGWQNRQRQVLAHAEHGGALCEDSLAELQMCNTLPCFDPQEDCLYSDWSSWTGCGAHGQRYRERQIARYASGSGSLCRGDLEETESCGEEERVDCVVSEWTAWDSCDKTCGGGQTHRQRQIMVFPANGGSVCPEDLIQTMGCNKNQCNVQDCQVSDWQAWSACSATCGPAQQHRSRAVLHMRNPGGVGCSLELSQLQACPAAPCPMEDCQWGEWQEWSGCSSSCDGGQQTRVRHIAKMPTGGGGLCKVQDKEEVQPCNTQACSVPLCQDGLWGDWEQWSPCSKSCGGGTTFRTRQVVRMADECGTPAAGKARETTFCNVDTLCEPTVDCLFTNWGGWSACSLTCNGIMKRSRRIERYGSGHGAYCEGALKETSPCNPTPSEATPSGCADDPPVDCELGLWSDWGACSSTCGGGEHTRTRMVTKVPANGGKSCDGPLSVVKQCAAMECPGPAPIDCEYGEWQEWGACGKCGGERMRFRHVVRYAEHGGKACEPFEAEEVGACPRQCHEKQYCTWADWGAWGDCTARCGEGKRMRRRYLALTDKPSAPPAPVTAMIDMYSELKRQSQNLDGHHEQELLLAFACGFCSFVVALLGLRGFLSMKRHTRQQRTDSSHLGELSAADLPLVGGA